MCGINGLVYFSSKKAHSDVLHSMNSAIEHRGPDHAEVFTRGSVGLGHARLSILDLSSEGNQPMHYTFNGRKASIVFNGEIYNFLEIKKDLIRNGFSFQSHTDTEVLLAGYLHYGKDLLGKINGMFSFVIFDHEANILFGARDRFGQKPLNYYFDQEQFIFSSESKAILKAGVDAKVDHRAIYHYLTLQYTPEPFTGFEGIKKVPHAHYFELNLGTKSLKIEKYYEACFAPVNSVSPDLVTEKLDSVLDDAVRLRLVADVPLGFFLSGGVDSSAIVAYASQYIEKVKTFSIVFKEKAYDERRFSRLVSQHFKTDHTEFEVVPQDFLSKFEKIFDKLDEPFADPSIFPTYLVSSLLSEHVTVGLSGDAGDELFGGYERHRLHFLLQKNKKFTQIACSLLGNRTNKDKIRKLCAYIDQPILRQHYNFTSYFDEQLLKKFFDFNDFDYVDEMISGISSKTKDSLYDVFNFDLHSYLVDDVNRKVDFASMYNSLEVRSPMLDYRFVNLCLGIPVNLKLDLRGGKKIFKKMLESRLPNEVLYRKKKGFSVPVSDWFRADLKKMLGDIIFDNSGFLRDIIDQKYLRKLYSDHQSGDDHGRKLWALMVLNLWHKKFVK